MNPTLTVREPLASLLIATSLAIASPAIADSEKPTESAKKVTYEDDVKPILREHCLNCHHQGDQRGGLAMDTYTAIREGGGSGEVVFDDGDADASRLWQLVNHDDEPVMPPGQPKLTDDKLAVIRTWIETGIPENSGSAVKAKPKNALAFVASSTGKPAGPPPMPESLPQRVPVVSDRASATTAIAASPWAPLVAIAGQRQIALYHADSGELLGILPFDEGIAQSLRFSSDGGFLIAGGGEHSVRGLTAVYNIKTGERVATVGDELDTIFDADASPDMTRIAMGGPQKMLRIFDATDGTQLFDIKKHTDWIYSVAFSPDGILIASGDRSGGLCIWEADTGRLYLELNEHKGAITSLSWRDDSNVLASASEDGTVRLWDMIAGKAIKTINAHAGGVMAVRFDHQGQLATAGNDKRVRLWDAAGAQKIELPPSAESVLEVAITHDSSTLIHGDWTGRVQSVAVTDVKQVRDLAANPPPAAKRLEAVKETLTTMKTQLAPLVKARDEAAAALKAAQASVANVQQQIAAVKQAIATTDQQIAQFQSQAKSRADQLPGLVAKSRDAHDAVIAARVALGTAALGTQPTPAASRSLADLEAQLVVQLTDIINNRRGQLDLADKVTAAQATKTEQARQLPPLEATLAEATEAIAPAAAKLTEAQSRHDVVANQLTEQEKKAQALAEAIQ